MDVKLALVALLAGIALAGCESEVPDVLTAIQTRKSIRKFDPNRKVEDEKLEKVLRAAEQEE